MSSKPNVVFIITDNQSDWTLGCYGNEEIQTPNIDKLAMAGVCFENAFCVNPVCSPNRATYLTGLMPSQHGVHNWLGGESPDSQMGPDAYCTIEEFESLPALLAEGGYHSGMVGKWHLGDSLHRQLGFDYWFAKPKGHTHSFYDSEAIWNGEVYTEPRYFTDVIAEHAVDFLEQHHAGDKVDDPFFLYVGFNGPYGLDNDLRTGHRNRWAEYYADKEMKCFPRLPTHPWQKNYLDLICSEMAMRSYASAVSGVDDAVGRILKALDATGEAENTLVVYTADHGLCAGHHGFWGMGDHTRPMHMVEENLHIPLIFRHPAAIPQGRWSGNVCTYDFYRSMTSYLGLETAEDRPSPGRDYSDYLLDPNAPSGDWENTTFHEYENTRTIRTARYKLVVRHPRGPNELYDLIEDAGESTNLYGDSRLATVQESHAGKLNDFFATYQNSAYDLWNGGMTKAGRSIPETEMVE